MVITGATVGSYVWWRYPHFRLVCVSHIFTDLKLIHKFPLLITLIVLLLQARR
jgi:hypothetical protein